MLFNYMDYIILFLTNMKLYVLVVVFYILGLFWLVLPSGAIIPISLEGITSLVLGIIPWSIGLNGHLLYLLYFYVLVVCASDAGIALANSVLLYLLYYIIDMIVTTIGLSLCSSISSLVLCLSGIKLGFYLSSLVIISIGLYSIYDGYLRPYPILSLINSLLSDSVLALLLGIIHDIILLLNKIGLIIINVILVYIIILGIITGIILLRCLFYASVLAFLLINNNIPRKGKAIPNKPNTLKATLILGSIIIGRAIRILIIIPPTKPNTLRAKGILPSILLFLVPIIPFINEDIPRKGKAIRTLPFILPIILLRGLSLLVILILGSIIIGIIYANYGPSREIFTINNTIIATAVIISEYPIITNLIGKGADRCPIVSDGCPKGPDIPINGLNKPIKGLDRDAQSTNSIMLLIII